MSERVRRCLTPRPCHDLFPRVFRRGPRGSFIAGRRRRERPFGILLNSSLSACLTSIQTPSLQRIIGTAICCD